MGRITLHLRSGASITLISDAIVRFSAGSSKELAPVLIIRSAAGDAERFDLERVDIEEQMRQAAMGLPRVD